jgi:hypothetical protein
MYNVISEHKHVEGCGCGACLFHKERNHQNKNMRSSQLTKGERYEDKKYRTK